MGSTHQTIEIKASADQVWQNNDEPAHDFCHAIYVALLEDMKKSLE